VNPIIELVAYTAVAGVAIPIGGFVASIESIRPRWREEEFRQSVIAFAGGALISAVALVLIPDGTAAIRTWESITAFAVGGLTFWGLQILLDRSKSSASQLVAMLSDFIPEVIALGATIATGEGGAVLLAALIASFMPYRFKLTNYPRLCGALNRVKGLKFLGRGTLSEKSSAFSNEPRAPP